MANTIIQLKKSGATGNTPSTLKFGELALNYADGKLFYKNSGGSVVSLTAGLASYSFSTINASSTLILAGSSSDTLSFAGANGITIAGNSSTKTVTVGINPSTFNANVSTYQTVTNATTGTYYAALYNGTSGDRQVYANNALSFNAATSSLSLSQTDASPVLQIVNTNSSTNRYPQISIENYGGTAGTGGFPVVELKKSRGTSSSPTSVSSGDILGGFNTWGHNGSGFQSATRINGYAANTFSTSISAGLTFLTTLNNSQAERMRIDENGNVGIGSTSPSNWYGLSPQLLVTKSHNAETLLGIGNATTGASAQAGIRIIGGTGNSYYIFRLEDNNGSPYFNNNFGAAVNYTVWSLGGSERMRITSAGDVGIGTSSPTYKLQVNGSFAATTKSFVIDHPTKPDKKLRYGSLEGPENGVYIRGRLSNENTIELPEYWTELVDENSITVNLTPIGKSQNLFVVDISNNKIIIDGDNNINCFYTIFAERKDVEKLITEY